MRLDDARRRHGFTLLEALVATLVVAILLVPVLHGVVAGANASRVADRQLAARLALDRLLAALPMAKGKLIPDATGTDGTFSWAVVATLMAAAGHGVPFVPYHVRVSVSGGGTSVSFDTVRLGPG